MKNLIQNLQVLENTWMYMFTQTDGVYKKKNIAPNDKILVSKLLKYAIYKFTHPGKQPKFFPC